ncbi:MAG: hypothetical protein EXR57_04245 [Dehalococcoidia bacterium]|nr:hypothetical protein [Dehalococcoidia bacterium]MSQ35010.1 hypothetical protein [Dehalococcoidia bacterium]
MSGSQSPFRADYVLDLHGMTVEQAKAAVDRHLNRCFRAGLPFVHIIHGHGTGALKEAVKLILKRHPLVDRHNAATPAEGGYGVTVAHLGNSVTVSKPLSREEIDALSKPKALKRR